MWKIQKINRKINEKVSKYISVLQWWLAWQACLKKTVVKLELLTDYGMVLMIEKGIRGGICQATHRHAKANNM